MDIQKYFQKKSQLPEEAQIYLSSAAFDSALAEFSKKYGLDKDQALDLCLELVAADFNFLSLDKIIKDLGSKAGSINQITVDFLGMLILPLSPYMNELDISGEIAKRSGRPSDYQQYIDALADEIEEENSAALADYFEEYFKNINPQEEENHALELLGKRLIDLLSGEADLPNIQLNAGVIYLMMNKEGFIRKLLDVIVASTERLGANLINLSGTQSAPTLANWLKDFMSIYGSDYYDDLKISDYLANGKNTRGLSDRERGLLGKFFVFHRNVRFFPTDFEELPIEDWLIIPFSKQENIINQPGEKKAWKLPFPREQMKKMSAIEKIVAMQEYNLTEEDWQKNIK